MDFYNKEITIIDRLGLELMFQVGAVTGKSIQRKKAPSEMQT